MSNGLDSDQHRHIVLSDLGPNRFLTVSADDKLTLTGKELK